MNGTGLALCGCGEVGDRLVCVLAVNGPFPFQRDKKRSRGVRQTERAQPVRTPSNSEDVALIRINSKHSDTLALHRRLHGNTAVCPLLNPEIQRALITNPYACTCALLNIIILIAFRLPDENYPDK